MLSAIYSNGALNYGGVTALEMRLSNYAYSAKCVSDFANVHIPHDVRAIYNGNWKLFPLERERGWANNIKEKNMNISIKMSSYHLHISRSSDSNGIVGIKLSVERW